MVTLSPIAGSERAFTRNPIWREPIVRCLLARRGESAALQLGLQLHHSGNVNGHALVLLHLELLRAQRESFRSIVESREQGLPPHARGGGLVC